MLSLFASFIFQALIRILFDNIYFVSLSGVLDFRFSHEV